MDLSQDLTDPRLERSIPEVNYLHTEKTHRYRLILRYFYRAHENHRSWISESEVHAFLQDDAGVACDLAECRRDLDKLVTWNSLIADFDHRDASSVPDYHERGRRYQMTPYAVRIERFVVNVLEAESLQGGSLDTTLLDRLWQRLLSIDDLLGKEELSEGDLRELHGHWEDVHDVYFTRTHESAVDYTGTIRRLRPTDLGEREALRVYKDALTEYLTDFVNELSQVGERVRGMTEGWRADGRDERLAERVATAQFDVIADPALTSTTTRGELQRELLGQVRRMTEWFAEGGDIDEVRRTTTHIIGDVVQNVRRLSEVGRGGMSRRKNLEAVAQAFSHVDDLADAHRLYGAIFGPPVPRHVLGSRTQTILRPDESIWDQQPTLITLDPIARGQSAARGGTAIRDRRAEKLRRFRQEQARRARRRELFDRIFGGDAIVDLRGVTLDAPEVRDALLAIVNKCLSKRDRRHRSDIGIVFEVLPPEEADSLHAVRAPDGHLWAPGYRLRRLDREVA